MFILELLQCLYRDCCNVYTRIVAVFILGLLQCLY